MKEIECPYCGYEYDLNHDDGAFYDEGEAREDDCPKCVKKFLVHSSMSWSFEGEKCDCLNDGKHTWVKEYRDYHIAEHPQLASRERCVDCGEKRTV